MIFFITFLGIALKVTSFHFIIFRGVILMRLEYAGKIQSASLMSATETETDDEEAVAVTQ